MMENLEADQLRYSPLLLFSCHSNQNENLPENQFWTSPGK